MRPSGRVLAEEWHARVTLSQAQFASHQLRVMAVKELPDDLAVMGVTELAEQRALRDDAIAPLFRRWPALKPLELSVLRRMYAERLRIARYLGLRRGT